MELFLQCGWGMMDLSKELVRDEVVSTVILSPRDLKPKQVRGFSKVLLSMNGCVLLDPQFYLPRSNHKRLNSHEFWPDNYDTEEFDKNSQISMIKNLYELNLEIETRDFIIPGEKAIEVNDLWLKNQMFFYETAKSISKIPLILTICLSADVLKDNDQINLVMQFVESTDADYYYLVLEHPSEDYLVDDPVWLCNVLNLACGISLRNKDVIIGYSNQQQLFMTCAGVKAIASGNYKNVRRFATERFMESSNDPNAHPTRSVWFYSSTTLSEFQLSYIDIALQLGFDPSFFTHPPATKYTEQLFSVTQPSLSGWGEREAFRHYLIELKKQTQLLSSPSYIESFEKCMEHLCDSSNRLVYLHDKGIVGKDRDFSSALQPTITSLNYLNEIFGARLKRSYI